MLYFLMKIYSTAYCKTYLYNEYPNIMANWMAVKIRKVVTLRQFTVGQPPICACGTATLKMNQIRLVDSQHSWLECHRNLMRKPVTYSWNLLNVTTRWHITSTNWNYQNGLTFDGRSRFLFWFDWNYLSFRWSYSEYRSRWLIERVRSVHVLDSVEYYRLVLAIAPW